MSLETDIGKEICIKISHAKNTFQNVRLEYLTWKRIILNKLHPQKIHFRTEV